MIYPIVLCVVVAALCGVTIVKAARVKNRTDFLVAGRSLPWPVLVFTLLSSWIGAGSLFAGAELAYKNGFAALWQSAGGWVGLLIIYFVAGRARRFAQFTIPDLLEARYNATARVLGTIAIVISYTTITSYQFKAGGDILHLIFPSLDRDLGMYIVAAFVIAFTAAAGMASIAYLDLLIGALVTVAVMVAVPVLLMRGGGWAHVRHSLPDSHFQVFGNLSPVQALGFLLPTALLLIGNQGMYQKFFSARSERDAKYSVAGWIVGTVTLETLLVSLAVIGSAQFHTDRPREIIPLTARLGMPAWIGAVLMGGVFAKVVSTANNYLFSPATNLIHDVYARFMRKEAGERETMLVSRLIVVLLGVYAVVQATQFESILAQALYAYTIYGAAITPVVMAAFFSKRATTAAAIASIACGTLVTLAAKQSGSDPDLAVYPALAASLIALVVVSLLTRRPPEEKLKPFY
ncbi:MAG TPA: sodium:solute symporter family protein [Bryobacteraceae bacterium]|jgi:SSS family solute:Na+ symporter/sodium/proline symporter|nr:sodium:solute symporter family protein [Bryobacteraceae bacterium]